MAFSIARSRFALPTSSTFLTLNGLGVVLGIIYNMQTPDLYKHNAHHSLGWIATWIMAGRVATGVLLTYSERQKDRGSTAAESMAFLPLSRANLAQQDMTGCENEASTGGRDPTSRLLSSFGSSSRSSVDSLRPGGRSVVEPKNEDEGSEEQHSNRSSSWYAGFFNKYLSVHVASVSKCRLLRASNILVEVVDRTILILGFIALLTGGVTYAGIFVSQTSDTRDRY